MPTFLKVKFNKKFPKKPQRIFVGSMSEIYHWESGWVDMVIERIKKYPQHTFMFLTQHPEVYAQHLFAPNCWYGVTMTGNKPIERVGCIPTKKGLKFLSIEPLLEKIDIGYIDDFEPNWIIVGAETGKRKGKIIPKKEWIEDIVRYCKKNNIPIYLKDSVLLGNIKNIYSEEIKEFPGVK
jgi:protein gp37